MIELNVVLFHFFFNGSLVLRKYSNHYTIMLIRHHMLIRYHNGQNKYYLTIQHQKAQG